MNSLHANNATLFWDGMAVKRQGVVEGAAAAPSQPHPTQHTWDPKALLKKLVAASKVVDQPQLVGRHQLQDGVRECVGAKCEGGSSPSALLSST